MTLRHLPQKAHPQLSTLACHKVAQRSILSSIYIYILSYLFKVLKITHLSEVLNLP